MPHPKPALSNLQGGPFSLATQTQGNAPPSKGHAASVLWGLALTTRLARRLTRPAWLLDLHRFFGGAALVFTGIHVVAILLDGYVPFGLAEVLVPLTGTWHPVAVAWGIVGLYLLAALELTSLARARLPQRLWRRVHYLSFPLFVLTTVHALSAGTDRHAPVVLWGIGAVCATLMVLTALRLASAGRAPEVRRVSLAERASRS